MHLSDIYTTWKSGALGSESKVRKMEHIGLQSTGFPVPFFFAFKADNYRPSVAGIALPTFIQVEVRHCETFCADHLVFIQVIVRCVYRLSQYNFK